jgi:hypothetical protein
MCIQYSWMPELFLNFNSFGKFKEKYLSMQYIKGIIINIYLIYLKDLKIVSAILNLLEISFGTTNSFNAQL